MAFRRRAFGRRRRRFRRGRSSYRGSGYSVSRPAMRYLQPRTSRNVPRVQTTHFWQTAPIGQFCNSTSVPTAFPYFVSGCIVNGVPTANGTSGRIGGRILMQSLVLSGHVRYQPWTGYSGALMVPPSQPSMHCTLFLVYFSGRQPPDTSNLPHPFSDFLNETGTTNPLPRLDPVHPYRIIWRKRFRFDLTAFAQDANDVNTYFSVGKNTLYEINKKIRLNLPTIFGDAPAPTPTWDTIRQGQLQLMCYYPHATTSGLPVFEIHSRLAFVEY